MPKIKLKGFRHSHQRVNVQFDVVDDDGSVIEPNIGATIPSELFNGLADDAAREAVLRRELQGYAKKMKGAKDRSDQLQPLVGREIVYPAAV